MLRATGTGASPIEIIEPREVPLGGVRAMDVRRTLPQRARSFIGAWCFLDHYGPDDVSLTGGMDVPAHPHTGLQTVSWLFSGEIEHRDSAGFHAFVRPGELNLMTAGNGISHSERSTPSTTLLHGAQLWTVLPRSARETKKTLDHYVPPVLDRVGYSAQVFLGSLLGDTAPVPTHTPLVGAEIRLQPGARITIDSENGLLRDFEYGLLADDHAVTLAVAGYSTIVDRAQLAYIPTGTETLSITAGREGARLLFIGGAPFTEEVIMWWNFIAHTHEEIAKARSDWQKEISAVGVGDPSDPDSESRADVPEGSAGRYGLPDDEPAPPLPAPKLPIARLKPRALRHA